MKPLLRIAVLVCASLLCSAAFAQSAVGKWTGRVDLSASKGKDANEQHMIDAMKKALASATAKLELKKDHTYHIEFSGIGTTKSTSEDGKWSQSGKVVTVIDPKSKKETMTMSSDGKKMTMVPRADEHAPSGMKMTFTRG